MPRPWDLTSVCALLACFPELHGGLRAAETLSLSLHLIPYPSLVCSALLVAAPASWALGLALLGPQVLPLVSAATLICTLEKASEAALRVQSSDKVTSISLPAAPAYHIIEFQLEVLSLPSTPATEDCGPDAQDAGTAMSTTDHKVGPLSGDTHFTA